MTGPLKNIEQAAEWLGIPEKTLRALVEARKVPFTKPGGTRHIRFSDEHLEQIAAMGEFQPDRTPAGVIRLTHPPAGPSTPTPPPGPKPARRDRAA